MAEALRRWAGAGLLGFLPGGSEVTGRKVLVSSETLGWDSITDRDNGPQFSGCTKVQEKEVELFVGGRGVGDEIGMIFGKVCPPSIDRPALRSRGSRCIMRDV